MDINIFRVNKWFVRKIFIFFKGGNDIICLVRGDILGSIKDKLNPPEMHLPGY